MTHNTYSKGRSIASYLEAHAEVPLLEYDHPTRLITDDEGKYEFHVVAGLSLAKLLQSEPPVDRIGALIKYQREKGIRDALVVQRLPQWTRLLKAFHEGR